MYYFIKGLIKSITLASIVIVLLPFIVFGALIEDIYKLGARK